MTIDIVTVPALRVAAVRHRGSYHLIKEAFDRLGAIAGPAGLFQRPDTAMVALYHDDPTVTPAEELRSDAGVVVSEEALLPAGLDEQRIPAGRYAWMLFVGPYSRLGEGWNFILREWLPSSGHRLDPHGVTYERYRSPMNLPPDKLETEIWVPVQ